MQTFRGNSDYLSEFESAVTALIDSFIEDRDERKRAVSKLIDEYVTEIGERPEDIEIERLADYILYEDLEGDRRTNKASDEYPILSERQLERRRDNEYPLELAEHYDLDGINRAKPERRHRIAREERFIDKVSRQKNRARNAQYKRDTSPGPVERYNLNETGGELKPEFVTAADVAETWRERLSCVY